MFLFVLRPKANLLSSGTVFPFSVPLDVTDTFFAVLLELAEHIFKGQFRHRRLGLWRLPNIRTISIPTRWTLLGASMRGIAILISGTLLLLWLFGLLHGQADFVVLHANDFHLYFLPFLYKFVNVMNKPIGDF